MRKFYWLFLFLFLFSFSPELYAIKAKSGPITIVQPDGSKVVILLRGDEYFHYATTVDGYIIAQGNDGFYYYADYSSGVCTLTSVRVGGSTSGITRSRTISPSVMNASRRSMSQRNSVGVRQKIGEKRVLPKKCLVILAQFADLQFSIPNVHDQIDRSLNEQWYSDNGSTGSARDYFFDNSMGTYALESDVSQVITLPHNMDYYGANDLTGNDINPRQMVIDACMEVDKLGVNFADYDSDNDGVVDNVFIYYAGYSEASGASKDAIWPHSWDVESFGVRIDGKLLSKYACASELLGVEGTTQSGIGTFCHEFLHVLGLSDLYDVNGVVGGEYSGFMYFSIMDCGDYSNNGRTPPYLLAIEREMLGWIEIETIVSGGDYTLETIDKNKAYKLETINPGEYFVIENRQNKTGWDRYLGASGVMIYHIDKSNNIVGGIKAIDRWPSNKVNDLLQHPCAKMIKAVDVESDQNPDKVLFPGSSAKTSFTATTTPSSLAWSGIGIGKDITDIVLNNQVAKFKVTMLSNDASVALGDIVVGQTDAFVNWTNSDEKADKWEVKWRKDSQAEFQQQVVSKPRSHIANLEKSTTYELVVTPLISGVLGKESSSTLTTLASTSSFAAIGAMKSSFKIGETIPLMLLNLPQIPISIMWSLDGIKITDFQIEATVVGAHTLKCTIGYSASNIETITRKIKIVE